MTANATSGDSRVVVTAGRKQPGRAHFVTAIARKRGDEMRGRFPSGLDTVMTSSTGAWRNSDMSK